MGGARWLWAELAGCGGGAGRSGARQGGAAQRPQGQGAAPLGAPEHSRDRGKGSRASLPAGHVGGTVQGGCGRGADPWELRHGGPWCPPPGPPSSPKMLSTWPSSRMREMNSGTGRWYGTRGPLGALKLVLSRARRMTSLERTTESVRTAGELTLCGAPLDGRTGGRWAASGRSGWPCPGARWPLPSRVASAWHAPQVSQVGPLSPSSPASERAESPARLGPRAPRKYTEHQLSQPRGVQGTQGRLASVSQAHSSDF